MQQQVHTAKVQEVYTLRKREEKEAGRGQYQVDLWEIKIYVHVRGRQTICMYGKQVHLRAHQGICQTFIQRVSPERESAIEEFFNVFVDVLPLIACHGGTRASCSGFGVC